VLELDVLGIDLVPWSRDEACDVAPRPCQISDDAGGDRVTGYPDDRNSCRGRPEMLDKTTGVGKNHIGPPVDHLAGELREALGAALGRPPLHDKVLALDITEPAQLGEESAL
jgi:hypothetical protein